ncbi:MAG TPA: hypothetical protein VGO50_08050 [Pyrinomonadaceae bacterium]|jgi:hypothetical protein|nr:hypothetical protein [Pyrinomonadaceae bacterium]
MYRRTLFLETLHKIREEMSREADYDVDLFAEMVRGGFHKEVKAAPVKRKKKTIVKSKAKP